MIQHIKAHSRKVVMTACLLAIASYANAEDAKPAPVAPKFDIQSYKIIGNSLLSEDELSKAYSPYVGSNKDFSDIQHALEKIQDLYLSRGFSSVQVSLPEQELENGLVTLEVKEQSIVNVSVEGGEHHDNENILASVPSIKEGELPNSKVVARNLKVVNENPSKQTVVLFKNNENDAGVDATVKVIDDKPWKAFGTIDNSGTQQTGYSRLGFGFQHYNVLNKDHRFTGQFVTNSPTDKEWFDVKIFGLGYSIPLYQLGDSIDFNLGYSDVSAGTTNLPGTNAGISVTGRGLVGGAKYNHNFDKIGNLQHRLSFGLDFRAYRNQVDLVGLGASQSLQDPITTSPFSLSYSGLWQSDEQAFAYNISHVVNAPYTNHSSASTFTSYAADRYFSKTLYSMDYSRPFVKNWRIRFGVSGQTTEDHLIAGEQFGAGGMDSVRGFRERVVAGDKGYRWVTEAIGPDFGKNFNDQLGMRSVLFLEGAHINNEHDINGNLANRINIASIGGGLRLNYAKDFFARLDYAMVLDGDKTATSGTRKEGDLYMHVSAGWIW